MKSWLMNLLKKVLEEWLFLSSSKIDDSLMLYFDVIH